MVCRVVLASLGFAWLQVGHVAHVAAQAAPVVVIVESANDSIRADGVRRALREAGVEALSLTDERASQVPEVLTVVIRADGRSATAQLRTPERLEVRFLRTQRPDARGRWLAAPLAGLIRAARAVRTRANAEVLDPWSTEPRVMEVTEVVDPWAGHPPPQMIATALARVPAASDVLDPWRDQPARRVRATPPSASSRDDIVDPWASERGERLDRPQPHD